MGSDSVLLGIEECKMCFALGNVRDKARWTGRQWNVLHIYNQTWFLTRLSSSPLNMRTLHLETAQKQFPSQKTQRPQTPSGVFIHVRPATEPSGRDGHRSHNAPRACETRAVLSFGVRLKWSRELKQGSEFRGSYAVTGPENRNSREILYVTDLWGSIKVGLLLLLSDLVSRWDTCFLCSSCFCLMGLCQNVWYWCILTIIGTMCWHKHTWQLHAAHVWIWGSPPRVTLVLCSPVVCLLNGKL